MILADFCKTLGFSWDAEKVLAPVWQEVVENFPGELAFLEDDFQKEWYPRIGNQPDFLPELLRVLQAIRNTPVLKFYAWVLYYGLNRKEMLPGLNTLPPPEKILGKDAGLFVLAVAIGSFPHIAETHRKLGLPEHYTMDLFDWFAGACAIHRAGHDGVPGLCMNQYYWERHYIDGDLFRIGRFEYLLHPVRDFVPAVFRHKKTGKLVVLSRDSQFYDQEGLQAESGFKAELIYADNCVTGTPITPDGVALCGKTVTLSLEEYEAAVTPWEWVPSMHIPGGGGMSPEKMLDSMRQAKVFFKKYFNRDIRMFSCASWILNPDWESEMPESNMVKFRRLGWASSCPPWKTAGFFFVFGREDVDLNTLPQDNSLYRAFCNLHKKGRVLRAGSVFIMTEDLDKLHDGFYREEGCVEC